jgi:hypothetical protein
MIEIIDQIKYDFLYKTVGEDSYYYFNMIYLDFNSPENLFIVKDNIIENINNYYLPFFQNFDRLDDK